MLSNAKLVRGCTLLFVTGAALVGGCGDAGDDAGGGGSVVWTGGGGQGAQAGAASSGGEGGGGGGAVGSTLDIVVGSTRATRIDAYFYAEAAGSSEVLVRTLEHAEGSTDFTLSVTRAELDAAGLTGVVYYGLRAWGPNWPWDAAWTPGSEVGFIADVDAQGNRFNPNKLLIDPRAREISHDPIRPDMLDGSVYRTGLDNRAKDSAPVAPKSIWVEPATPADEARPTQSLADDTIYEVHVRGFTMSDPSVEAACRGTFKGAAEKAEYLADLGITAIELLPIQETPNSTNDLEVGTPGDNYWGYSTLAFFAPDRRYACDQTPGGPTRELREMVKTMHAHGIKVFMDVVYNHTSEGGVGDPNIAKLYSLRGLDNAGYYELATDPSHYADNTGIGANTNAASPVFRDLVVDSLAYFYRDIGVDGFRFDLAPVVANGCETSCFSFEPTDDAGIFGRAVTELPARSPAGGAGADLIAEPWALGAGTYRIGEFPTGMAEWNGIYRDTFRRDMNRLDLEDVTPRELVYKVVGSPDLFADDGRQPSATVNFLVSHDGFTLRDLFSCNAKQNAQPWPYGPSDGGENNNLSWDYGGDPVRQRQAYRTGLALLALSAGAPMITGGDELYRTLQCNNNAYNLDASTNWLDWSGTSVEPGLLSFAREILRFRRAHPALRPTQFPKAEDPDNNGLADWAFLTDQGVSTSNAYLDSAANHFLAWRVDGEPASDAARSILVLYNGYKGTVIAHLPAAAPGFEWRVVADTASAAESYANIHSPGTEPDWTAATYDTAARSVVVLVELPAN
ncbi:MAG: alpha-amylase family glycosyl hydrolase [Polyangiaceae bacterium]